MADQTFLALDRDGTIVVDKDYLDDPGKLEFLPGAAEALAKLEQRKMRVVVVTNQSGVGRGRFSLQRLDEIHARLIEMVATAGGRIERIYACTHTPLDVCRCRKPEPELLLRAASDLGCRVTSAIVVGDKTSDVELGRRVGARTVLISNDASFADADFTVASLLDIVRLLEEGKLATQGIS